MLSFDTSNILDETRSFFYGDLWITIIILGLVLSFIFWIVCIAGIICLYYAGYRKQRLWNKLLPIVRDFIHQYVLSGYLVNHFPVDQLGISMKDPKVKRTIRSILYSYLNAIGGDKKKSIQNLFQELGFDLDAQYQIRHLNQKNLAIAGSLRDLSAMEITIDKQVIDRLLKKKDKHIQVAIRNYLLQYQGVDGFDQVFLTLHNITRLDAIEIYQNISDSDYVEGYHFYKWLNISQQNEVNHLIMDLMVHYQEYAGIAPLIRFIKESEDNIQQCKAVNTLGKLMQTGEESFLIAMYETASEKLKIEIIKALGRMARGQVFEFFRKVFVDEKSSLELKKHAVRSMLSQNQYNKVLIEDFTDKLSERDYNIVQYVRHPMNRYV